MFGSIPVYTNPTFDFSVCFSEYFARVDQPLDTSRKTIVSMNVQWALKVYIKEKKVICRISDTH